MANVLMCEGNLSHAVSGGREIPNVLACDTGWVIRSETQLLSDALATRIMSREDFITISSAVIAIFVVAVGFRLLLRQLTKETILNE